MDKRVPEFFQTLWSQALVAVTSAEEEAVKLVGRLQVAPDEARKQVQQLTERIATQRKDLEKRVEDSVKHSVARLRVPRRDELAQLTARVEALAKRVENL